MFQFFESNFCNTELHSNTSSLGLALVEFYSKQLQILQMHAEFVLLTSAFEGGFGPRAVLLTDRFRRSLQYRPLDAAVPGRGALQLSGEFQGSVLQNRGLATIG